MLFSGVRMIGSGFAAFPFDDLISPNLTLSPCALRENLFVHTHCVFRHNVL